MTDNLPSPEAGAPAPTVLRRLTGVLFIGQSIGSAGYLTSSTIGAILGARFAGHAYAGVPGALYLLGNALAAYPAARLMERTGRRLGLTIGFLLGLVGALLSGLAVITENFPGFLFGFSLMGAGRGFYDLGRYAAAEMYPPAGRARAISLVVFGGTIGSVLGPQLVAPAGNLAEYFGQDIYAGPWFISAGLFALGALLIIIFLHPDPHTLSHHRRTSSTTSLDPSAPLRSMRTILSQLTMQTAVAAMVIGQLVMVMIMAITSVHMKDHMHDLTGVGFLVPAETDLSAEKLAEVITLAAVGYVITAHTLGMFAFSLVSGRLADNFGRAPTILLGGGLLMVAALLAPLSLNITVLMLALFLLGIGWNFCYVAGAALLTDSLTIAERGRWQGGIDFAVAIVSATGNLLSGLIFDKLGYAAMNWAGLVVTTIPLFFAVWLIRSQASQVRLNESPS